MSIIYRDNVQRTNNRKNSTGRKTQFVSKKYIRNLEGNIIGEAKADKPHN